MIVIEDAAQAVGAEYLGRKVGGLGDLGIFSLNVTKNLQGGEGGLLVTNSKAYRDRAALIRFEGEEDPLRDLSVCNAQAGTGDPDHPFDQEGERPIQTVGWMYVPTELQAALARSQLRRLDGINAHAKKNGQLLSENLRAIPGLRPPSVPPDRTHIFHKYRVTLHPEELDLQVEPQAFRDLLLKALRAEGVEVVLWQTTPLPGQPLFRRLEGYGRGCPWRCHGVNRIYDISDYPVTKRLLDSSLVIGSQSYPLFAQPVELMAAYAEVFHKIFSRIGDLVPSLGKA